MTNEIESAYLDCMEELRRRLFVNADTLDIVEVGKGEPTFADYQFTALQFRKILELIAFSSLVANRQQYSAIYSDYSTHWNAKRLLTNIRRLNPDFYPKPLEYRAPDSKGDLRFEPVKTGYLTQDEFIELYNRASAALHTPNPFQPPSDLSFRLTFDEWFKRIAVLMRLHSIKLLGTKEWWIVKLGSTDGDGKSRLLVAFEIDADSKISTITENNIDDQ